MPETADYSIAAAIREAAKELADRPVRIAYTIDEAAQAIGVNRRAIQNLIACKAVRCRKVGKRYLISRDSLEKLFQ